MQIRFLSRNRYKIDETSRILQKHGIEIIGSNVEIEELQTSNTERLLRDKALKAFKQIGRPIFVEHTGLYLDLLNGFPGGLTQSFWDAVQKDKFAQLFASAEKVIAKTSICYVDGKKIHHFEGEIVGTIVSPPRIDHGFQWDCVFQPDGYQETFSEMGKRKDEISMRKIALEKLAEFIKGDVIERS